ncbi:basic salivary proline-rich protein 2-like [Penaeus monodon]|uniref:basic salivary proline-rich protein 2-like n=1 Tax=Penaeus monodon TaxID=6687 RepID=UPI0018A6E263|nr:basic salivary proline-rich protein 2-like [Penaeus monodon]
MVPIVSVASPSPPNLGPRIVGAPPPGFFLFSAPEVDLTNLGSLRRVAALWSKTTGSPSSRPKMSRGSYTRKRGTVSLGGPSFHCTHLHVYTPGKSFHAHPKFRSVGQGTVRVFFRPSGPGNTGSLNPFSNSARMGLGGTPGSGVLWGPPPPPCEQIASTGVCPRLFSVSMGTNPGGWGEGVVVLVKGPQPCQRPSAKTFSDLKTVGEHGQAGGESALEPLPNPPEGGSRDEGVILMATAETMDCRGRLITPVPLAIGQGFAAPGCAKSSGEKSGNGPPPKPNPRPPDDSFGKAPNFPTSAQLSPVGTPLGPFPGSGYPTPVKPPPWGPQGSPQNATPSAKLRAHKPPDTNSLWGSGKCIMAQNTGAQGLFPPPGPLSGGWLPLI